MDDIDQQFEAILPSFHFSLARDMQNIFEMACRCASVLEPWNQATFAIHLNIHHYLP